MTALFATLWLVAAGFMQPITEPPGATSDPDTSARAWQVDVVLRTREPDEVQPGGVEPDETATRRGSFVLRLADDQFRLELGPVIVLGRRDASSASLFAWHEHDPTSAFVDQADRLDDLIRRNLPPLWCGPLADWVAGVPNSYPLVGHPWPTPPQVIDSAPPHVVLASARVLDQRSFHPETGVPLTEQIELQRQTGVEVMSLTFTPLPPGDPGDWSIDADARQRVSSIAALRPQPARIAPGSSIVPLRLFDAQGRPFDWWSAFASESSAASERRATALVLGLFVLSPREGRPDEVLPPQAGVELLNAIRARVETLAARRQSPRVLLLTRPVAVFDVPDFNRDLLDGMAAASAALRHEPLLPEVEQSVSDFLWAQPPRETIDLVSPGAQNAIVVVDPARRLVAAVRVTGDAKAVVEAVTQVLLGEPREPREPRDPGSEP